MNDTRLLNSSSFLHRLMDLHFSGKNSVIKTRKPYTITKERGRWTTEEHDRFLEALKLYGRSWPRIKEHVGTKTAVQIRSHAQKFFAKLENKPHFEGIPSVEAPDIDIPPPRRKRKSTNPYPRKTRPASSSSQPEIRDENLPTPRPCFQSKLILDFEKEQVHEKTIREEQTTNENENHDHNRAGNLLHEESGSVALTDTSFSSPMAALGNSSPDEGFLPSEKEVTDGDARQFSQHNDSSKASVEQLDRGHSCSLPGYYDIQPTQNYPSYVAVNSLDGSLGITLPEIHLKENGSSESHDNDMRCILRSSPDLQAHFIPLCHNPDDYIHTSPTFPNLISRALLQNPAARAAASYAAALWPAESAVCNQRCFCCMQSNSRPVAAAIAGVTVAPAAARWANHGLLPLTVPCHAGLNCAPSFGNPVTIDREAGCLEKFRALSSVPKPHLSMTVSKESMDQNVNGAKEYLDRGKGLLIFEHDDLNNCKIESWKEVSHEGRPAFQVLYTREGFLPPQDAATRETIGNMRHIEGDNVHFRRSVKSGCRLRDQSSDKNKSPMGIENVKGITIGLGYGKTNNHQTGFKPYKRCSIDKGSKKIRSENTSLTGNQNVREGKITIGLRQGETHNHQTGFKPYKRCSIDKGSHKIS